MKSFKLLSASDNKTLDIGKQLAKGLKDKEVLILEGDLGAGKTTLTKGLLQGLGYKHRVLSPTFTLMRQYKAKFLVNHLDLYRLSSKEFLDIGVFDFLYSPESISVIEWGDKIAADLEDYIRIEFSFLSDVRRSLNFTYSGQIKERLSELKRIFK